MFTVFTLLQFSEKLFSHSEAFRTVFAVCFQVASRVLGIPSSKIHISETSTNTVPNTSATAASASSDLNGAALKNACEILLKRLEPLKAKNPNGTWEDWVNRAKFVIVLFWGGGFIPIKYSSFNCTWCICVCLPGESSLLWQSQPQCKWFL